MSVAKAEWRYLAWICAHGAFSAKKRTWLKIFESCFRALQEVVRFRRVMLHLWVLMIFRGGHKWKSLIAINLNPILETTVLLRLNVNSFVINSMCNALWQFLKLCLPFYVLGVYLLLPIMVFLGGPQNPSLVKGKSLNSWSSLSICTKLMTKRYLKSFFR